MGRNRSSWKRRRHEACPSNTATLAILFICLKFRVGSDLLFNFLYVLFGPESAQLIRLDTDPGVSFIVALPFCKSLGRGP